MKHIICRSTIDNAHPQNFGFLLYLRKGSLYLKSLTDGSEETVLTIYPNIKSNQKSNRHNSKQK